VGCQGLVENEVDELVGEWGNQKAFRHGHQLGYIIFGGRKWPVLKPRVREKIVLPDGSFKIGKEIELKTYARMQRDTRDTTIQNLLARQVSARDYAGAINATAGHYGVARSSVLRKWKTITEKKLEDLLERPIPPNILVVYLDAKFFQGECVMAALGLDEAGTKHILGIWNSRSESFLVARDFLSDLVRRGLDQTKPILFVLDGSKAFPRAIFEIFDYPLIQRCRIHKMRNICQYLPDILKDSIAKRISRAWNMDRFEDAHKELMNIIQFLKKSAPKAAATLKEGLTETLTLQKLQFNQNNLSEVLDSNNLIESVFAQVEHFCRRVTYWKNA